MTVGLGDIGDEHLAPRAIVPDTVPVLINPIETAIRIFGKPTVVGPTEGHTFTIDALHILGTVVEYTRNVRFAAVNPALERTSRLVNLAVAVVIHAVAGDLERDRLAPIRTLGLGYTTGNSEMSERDPGQDPCSD